MFWNNFFEDNGNRRVEFCQVCLNGRSLIILVNQIKWETNVGALLYFLLLYRLGLWSLHFTYKKCYMTKGSAVVLYFYDTVRCLLFSPLKDEHLMLWAKKWDINYLITQLLCYTSSISRVINKMLRILNSVYILGNYFL